MILLHNFLRLKLHIQSCLECMYTFPDFGKIWHSTSERRQEDSHVSYQVVLIVLTLEWPLLPLCSLPHQAWLGCKLFLDDLSNKEKEVRFMYKSVLSRTKVTPKSLTNILRMTFDASRNCWVAILASSFSGTGQGTAEVRFIKLPCSILAGTMGGMDGWVIQFNSLLQSSCLP